jgi:DNA-binding response OmpR family regulator
MKGAARRLHPLKSCQKHPIKKREIRSHVRELSSMHQPFILIIDDENQAADAARFILKRAGFDARAAYTPEEGLELAFETGPDAIILDVKMPRINGLEILRRLKAHPATAHIPVVLISGEEWLDCAGAFTCLIKPFDAAALVGATRNALACAQEPQPLFPLAA